MDFNLAVGLARARGKTGPEVDPPGPARPWRLLAFRAQTLLWVRTSVSTGVTFLLPDAGTDLTEILRFLAWPTEKDLAPTNGPTRADSRSRAEHDPVPAESQQVR